MPFIDKQGNYYEGEQSSIYDIEVPIRPSEYHTYNIKLKEWVLDGDKVLDLKKKVLNRLDEDLRTGLILMNLTDDEKKNLEKRYNQYIQILSTSNDPHDIEDLHLL